MGTINFQLKDNLIKYRSIFLNYKEPITYPKGHVFNMSGMPVTYLYYLLEGEIYVYTTSIYGDIRFIGTHLPNTIFNLDSFDHKKDAIITTKAFSKVQVIPLQIDDLINLCHNHPSLYQDLMIYITDVLRLMCYDAQEQSIHDIKTRFIHFIIFYTRENQTSIIPLSQYRISCAINASRVQVARICSQLKKEHLIDGKRNQIIVLDEQGLLKSIEKQDLILK